MSLVAYIVAGYANKVNNNIVGMCHIDVYINALFHFNSYKYLNYVTHFNNQIRNPYPIVIGFVLSKAKRNKTT